MDAILESLKSTLSKVFSDFLGFDEQRTPDWFRESSDVISILVGEKMMLLEATMNDLKNHVKQRELNWARRSLAAKLRDIKNKWWREKSKCLQQFANIRSHEEFFAGLKAIYGPMIRENHIVLNPLNGHNVSQFNDLMWICKEHSAQLLNRSKPIDWPTINSLAQAFPKLSMNVKPMMEELQKEIEQLCNGESPEADWVAGGIIQER